MALLPIEPEEYIIIMFVLRDYNISIFRGPSLIQELPELLRHKLYATPWLKEPRYLFYSTESIKENERIKNPQSNPWET